MKISRDLTEWSLTATGGPVPADLAGVARARDRPGHEPHRPAGGRPHPRPVPRHQRDLAGLDEAHRLAVRDASSTAARGARRAGRPASSTASTRSPTVTLDGRRARAARPTCTAPTASTSATLRRAADATLVRRPRLRARDAEAEAERLGTAPAGLPPAVQHGPQDGLLLRLGLGPGPADGRPVEARAGGALARGAPRPGHAAGHRGRRRRPGGVEVHVDDRALRPGRARDCAAVDRRASAGRAVTSRSTGDGCRPAPTRRRSSGRGPRRAAVVAGRPRRPAAVPSSTVDPLRGTARTARTARHLVRAGSASAPSSSTPRRTSTARAFTFVDQRQPDLRQGRQLDPRRPPAHPHHPRAARARALDQARRREPQPAARLGRRHLRVRRLLRRLRRAGRAGLAGLPPRLRGLPRGGAALGRDRGRGPRERRPPGAAPVAGALERRQREHLGLRGLGLEGAAGRPHLGRRLLLRAASRRSWPSSTPTRPYSDGQPVLPRLRRPRRCTPTTPTTAPTTSGTSGTGVDYTHYRDDVPRFCSEFGFQGPATWATLHRAVARRPTCRPRQGVRGVPAAPEGRGRQRQARPRPGARTSACPEDFADWHWATQLNQARARPVRHASTTGRGGRAPRARSSGSSTTAGR